MNSWFFSDFVKLLPCFLILGLDIPFASARMMVYLPSSLRDTFFFFVLEGVYVRPLAIVFMNYKLIVKTFFASVE